MFKKVVFASLAISVLSGCATLTTQNSKTVNVATSNGEKVEFMVDGGKYEAPGTVTLSKSGTDKVFKTDSEGCAGETVVPKKVETAFFGNIIIGGVVGSTTDAVGSKMWTYDDEVTINCN